MKEYSIIEKALLREVEKHLNGLVKPFRLLVCVSGGADSVALLYLLLRLGVECEVVNCNFHLRGEESDRDSRFVASLCDELGVSCRVIDFDTCEYCRANSMSEEMACRELRYAEFRRLKRELDCTRIVVAHNADDNIETMLLNLMRGTGLKGLCGMRTDDGEILRPLLGISRSQIIEFLDAIDATHITDSSNNSDYYKRNFLRLRVLPLLEEKWPGVRKTISATIENLNGVQKIVEHSLVHALNGTPHFVSHSKLDAYPDKRSLLFAAFSPLGATSVQIDEMVGNPRPGASWALPGGGVVALQSDGFRYVAHIQKRFYFSYAELAMTDELMRQISATKGNDVVYLPGDKALYDWTRFEAGMRIAPIGMKGSCKISDLLRDKHVPALHRSEYPILVEKTSGEVIWIPGIRRSRYAIVRPSDKLVTKIRLDDTLDIDRNSIKKF